MGFYQDHCIYLPAMVGWFLFSALLSSYNKVVFGSGMMAFPCPLLLTSIHFFVQWMFSWTMTKYCCYHEFWGGDRVEQMTWREYFGTSLPCGFVTSGDVGLSNLSLVTISITFYTMVKASTPIFVLLWAYLFGIERITPSILFVVFVISVGEFLTVVGEVDFHWNGFLLCLGASILSGARWTLVQLKIKSLEPPLKSTLATMRLLSPAMFFSMLILSLMIEEPWKRMREYDSRSEHHLYTILLLGLVGAIFAIAMILCEFYLIMHATAIILMIGGVIKEMITIIIGVTFFKDDLNQINVAGCFIVFSGVVFYKISYHLEKGRGKHEDILKVSDHGGLLEYNRVDSLGGGELGATGENGDDDDDRTPTSSSKGTNDQRKKREKFKSPKRTSREFFLNDDDNDRLSSRALNDEQNHRHNGGVEIVGIVRGSKNNTDTEESTHELL